MSPLQQNLSKQEKKTSILYIRSNKRGHRNHLLEPEPGSTVITLSSIMKKEPTLDTPLSKEEKKINQIAYVNA